MEIFLRNIYKDISFNNFMKRGLGVISFLIIILIVIALLFIGYFFIFKGEKIDSESGLGGELPSLGIFSEEDVASCVSNHLIINDGQTINNGEHVVSVDVEDTNSATITIDDVSESKDEGWSGKIAGVEVYVKEIFGPNTAESQRYVELYLNSKKLILEDNEEVMLGSESVDGCVVQFTNTNGKVSKIDIDISPYSFDDSVKYLKMGDSINVPIFDTLNFSLESINPSLTSEDRDYILIEPSAEKSARLKFINRAGKEYDIDILRPSPVMIDATLNATELGVGENSNLVSVAGLGDSSSNNANISINDYFITCNNDYTQIWQLEKIEVSGGDQYVKVRDQGSGTTGDIQIPLGGIISGSTGTLTLGDGSSTTITYLGGTDRIQVSKACNYLYTEKGAMISLDNADNPFLKLDEIRIFEETEYNGGRFFDNQGDVLGKSINIRFAYDSSGRNGYDLFVRDIMSGSNSGLENKDYWRDSVGDYNWYYLTKYGSFIKQIGENDKKIEVWYPESAANINFDFYHNCQDSACESAPIQTSSQPLYLGDLINTTKETLFKSDLQIVLADNTLVDDDGEEREVQLRIATPNTSIIYGDTPDNLDSPVIYTDFNDPDFKFSLRIIFPTAVDISKLTNEQITLFGKEYIFSGNTESLTENKIVLFEFPGEACSVNCVDEDEDGYGVCPDCDIVAGCDNEGHDCDDNNSAINLGVSEICDDNIDNNCDSNIDEDCDDDGNDDEGDDGNDDEGDDGSGGGNTINTYTLNANQFEKGYVNQLALSERFKFSFSNEYHYATVTKIESSKITLQVLSKVQEAVLRIGDTNQFDLNEDDYADVSIRLNAIEAGKANLTINSIHEFIGPEEQGNITIIEEEGGNMTSEESYGKEDNFFKDNLYIFIIVLVILVILAVVAVIFILKNKKQDFKKRKKKSK